MLAMAEPEHVDTPRVLPPEPAASTAKKLYEPPRATFVPLRVEERLMVCTKTALGPCPAPPIANS
jgi:hypothetical protein